MENSFWFGCNITNFLVPNFDIDSTEELIAVCLGTVMLVLLYECLKTGRIIKQLKCNSVSSGGTSLFKLVLSMSSEKSNLIERPEAARCRQYREIWKVSDIFVHFLELIIGYLLMLIAMTFNGFLMIAICVGSFIGYFLYGSVLFNVAAQVVVQRIMCIGCEIKTVGDTTPIINATNDDEFGGPSTDNTEPFENTIEDESYTTVQVHTTS